MKLFDKSIALKKYLIYIFYFSFLCFLFSFNFQDSRTGGWYLQIIPDIPISDVTFLDSLTGYAVSNNGTPNDTGYIIKTTNGGDNWSIIYKDRMDLSRIKFINQQTGFTCGGTQSGTSYFFKTTNAGVNWNLITTAPFTAFFNDMAILNNDTIWLVDGDGLVGGLFRTTNGGQSWTNQFYQYNNNPDKIYMYNRNFGFMRRGDPPFSSYIGRTTNGGFNWAITNEDTAFTDIHFVDSLTGYMAGNIKKTIDGGLTWTYQNPPQLNYWNKIWTFSFVNKDTIWGTGGIYSFLSADRGIVYKTTNGGSNWGYQIPDTSFRIYIYRYVDFINNMTGWAYTNNKGLHTTIGGDPILYTSINNITNITVKNFELKQNYPNPYNNSSLIEYYINEPGWVRLKIFDITGREMVTLVNEEQNTGGYGVPVSVELSSGVYFYKLVYMNKKGEMQMETKKMLHVK